MPASGDPSVRKRLGTAALIMTASVLLSRILGYVRDAVVAARHGASAVTDVYYASFTLPDLMSYMLAGGALSITFLPMFSHYLHSDREEEGWACFSVIATTFGSIVAVAMVAAWFIAPWALAQLLPGFSEDQLSDAVRLTRIILPAQVFFVLGGLLGATVLARERFVEAALAPIVYNTCIIVGGLALGPWVGIDGFSWGVLAGAFLGPFGLMLFAARRRGLRYSPRWSVSNPDFRRFLMLSLPVMLGFSLMSVDEWISRYYASGMEPGAISWLQNARRLMLVPVAVLGQAAGQATLPFLARLDAEGKRTEAAGVLADALRVVAFGTLAASAWMAACSEPVIGLFYERGAFTGEDTAASASALTLFSIGILAWSAQALLSRGFYALQDTWTPMLIATGVTAAAVPMYWALGARYGHRGLALATSLGMIATAVGTWIALQRRLPLPGRALGVSVMRSALVAGAGGAAAWAALRLLGPSGHLIGATVGSAAFGVVVLVLATVLRVPEWRTLRTGFLRRLRR